VKTWLITGNVGLDVEWDKTPRGDGEFISTFRNINDTSRLFKNFDEFGRKYDAKKYCYFEVTSTSGIPGAEWFQYSYLGYRNIGIKRIFGVPIPKKNIVLGQLGWSRMPIYGRGIIAPGLEDGTILRQIKQAYAVIAKYKAIPRKIIRLGGEGDAVNAEELEEFKTQIEGTQKGENVAVNKDFKIEDLSYAGQDVNLDPALQHVWRSTISGLTPAYLIGFALDANRATSSEIKVPFWLRVLEFRKTFTSILNKNVLSTYFKAYPWLSRDATFKFGDVSIDSTDVIIEQHAQAWLNDAITLNEYRKSMGKPIAEDGDKYKYQIDLLVAQQRMQGQTSPQTQPAEPLAKRQVEPILIDSGIHAKAVANIITHSLKGIAKEIELTREMSCTTKHKNKVEKIQADGEVKVSRIVTEMIQELCGQASLYSTAARMSESQKDDYMKFVKASCSEFAGRAEVMNMQSIEKAGKKLRESLAHEVD